MDCNNTQITNKIQEQPNSNPGSYGELWKRRNDNKVHYGKYEHNEDGVNSPVEIYRCVFGVVVILENLSDFLRRHNIKLQEKSRIKQVNLQIMETCEIWKAIFRHEASILLHKCTHCIDGEHSGDEGEQE